jgi:hypothetical protein
VIKKTIPYFNIILPPFSILTLCSLFLYCMASNIKKDRGSTIVPYKRKLPLLNNYLNNYCAGIVIVIVTNIFI